jgi:hypothetical protein
MAAPSVLSTSFLLAPLPAANGRGSCRGFDARAWRAEIPLLAAPQVVKMCPASVLSCQFLPQV